MYTPNRWIVLAIASSALLLVVIDMTVLYTALPTLTHDLNATASQKLWIVNAYALVVAGLLPTAGALSDRYGHKPMLLAGLAIFGVASIFAAFAPDAGSLIAARAALAVGAAVMMPTTLSIIRIAFTDERERAMAIGVWASIASGGAALGPVVGGALLSWFWWGSVFLINAPIVMLALAGGAWLIAPSRPNPARRIDLIGSALAMAGVIALAVAIKEIGSGARSLPVVLGGFAISGATLTLFVRRQQGMAAPMIDFRMFRKPAIAMGMLVALLTSVAMIGVELVYSQRLQLVLGLSPLEAALSILPLPLGALAAGPLAGMLVGRVGAPRVMWTGMAVAGAALTLFIVAPAQGQLTHALLLAAASGGLGGAMTAASAAIMGNAPADHSGMAASVEEVSYELGGAIGVAAIGGALSGLYSSAMDAVAGAPAAARDSIDGALRAAGQMSPDMAATLLSEARLAFDNSFYAVLGMAAALVLATAVLVRVATRHMPAPARVRAG